MVVPGLRIEITIYLLQIYILSKKITENKLKVNIKYLRAFAIFIKNIK